MTNNKSNKKDWIIVLGLLSFIFLMIILTSIDIHKLFGGLSSEMKTRLDYYDDEGTKCTSKLSSMLKSGEDISRLKNQLVKCEEIVNDAKIEINSWARDKDSEEIEAAKLDYEINSDAVDIYYILFNMMDGDYNSNEDYLERVNSALDLIGSVEKKFNTLENKYSETEYFERYYLTEEGELEESKEGLRDLKEQLLDAKKSLS